MFGPKVSKDTEKWLLDHKVENDALQLRQIAAMSGQDVAAYNRSAIAFSDALQAATGQGGMSPACVQDGRYILENQLRPENK
jgi:hypothetical protein